MWGGGGGGGRRKLSEISNQLVSESDPHKGKESLVKLLNLLSPWYELLCKCLGNYGGGGQILSSCYHVYKELPQKDVQNVENKRGKKLSGYKQFYTYKNQSLQVSKIYEFGSRYM